MHMGYNDDVCYVPLYQIEQLTEHLVKLIFLHLNRDDFRIFPILPRKVQWRSISIASLLGILICEPI